VRIVVEPERLVKMFSIALLYKSSPATDNVPIEFTPKGAIIKDASLQILATYALFPKHYFLEYDVKENKKIAVTKSLFKMIKNGFKGTEAVTLTLEEGYLVISSQSARYKEPLPEIEETEFPLKITKNQDLGIYLPENFEPKVVARLTDEDFGNLMKAEYYTITYKGGKLWIALEDIGRYEKVLRPIKVLKGEEGAEVILDGDMLRRILANITGEIILAFNQDMAIFERISKEYVQIFVLLATAPSPEALEHAPEETELEELEEEESEEEEKIQISERELPEEISEEELEELAELA